MVLQDFFFVGNKATGTTGETRAIDVGSAGPPTSDNCIIAYNRMENESNECLVHGTEGLAHGIAVVQNVFERKKTASSGTIEIYGAGNTKNSDHIILWYNTNVGDGAFILFNDRNEIKTIEKIEK